MLKQLSVFSAALMLVATSAFAVKPGDKAPAFTLTDHTGTEHSLSDFTGKVVVLEWTNPGCPFVKDCYEREVTQKIISSFEGNSEVVYVGVNSTSADHDNYMTGEELGEWFGGKDAGLPVLMDPSGEVGRAYGAKTTPHVIVIDREGVVQYNGAIDNNPFNRKGNAGVEPYAANAIGAVLKGEAPEPAATEPWGCSIKYGKPLPAASESGKAAQEDYRPEAATAEKSCCSADKTACCKSDEKASCDVE